MCDASEKPRVKIGDLGLAAYIEPGAVYIKRAGTTAFMAPEVMMDEPTCAKSDVWSLGIILYTLLASHLPFASKFYSKADKALAERSIPYTDDVFHSLDPECVKLLKGMLGKDKTTRYSINEVMASPWVLDQE